ncbi:lactonase family protein [Actinomadura miaoliensis]|uniref:lactonase family protein n=1 Tax=Actinomadura miaoliensis TaxID=430685 RepID=UPI0031E85331
MSDQRFWVGAYTGDQGAGRGVYRARRDSGSGAFELVECAAEVANPSYLATHPGRAVLYAVSELTEGAAVVAYAVGDDGELRRLGSRQVPAGPCHVAVAPGGECLVVSCYVAGAFAAVRLAPDGSFDGDVAVLPGHGNGPREDRQEGPHAHAAVFAPDGTVLGTDLGADLVRAFRVEAGVPRPVADIAVPPGCGPRHLVVHPSGTVFLITELANMVLALRPGDGYADLAVIGESPATAEPVAADATSAAIKLSPDGRRVYTSTRGADVITVHEVAGDGTGLRPVADVPCGGHGPRDLHVDADWLHAANQGSGDVATFRLVDGVPRPQGRPVEAPTPVCVIPAG